MIPICPVVSFTYGKGKIKMKTQHFRAVHGFGWDWGRYNCVLIAFGFISELFVISV